MFYICKFFSRFKFNFTTDYLNNNLTIHPSVKLINIVGDRSWIVQIVEGGGPKYPIDKMIAIATCYFLFFGKLIDKKYVKLFLNEKKNVVKLTMNSL